MPHLVGVTPMKTLAQLVIRATEVSATDFTSQYADVANLAKSVGIVRKTRTLNK